MIRNLDAAILAVRRRLPEYLSSLDIDPSDKFLCLFHKERKPSCNLTPDKLRIRCWGCGWSGDLFDIIAAKEGLPLEGAAFIDRTLRPLCEKFGIELERAPITAEEAYRLNVYHAYAEAARYVARNAPGASNEVKEYVQDHKWNPEVLADLRIGGVDCFPDYIKAMVDAGFTEPFLREIDLHREDIFGPNRVIFTVADEYGSPVGFAARDASWTEDSQGPKYVNQRSTGLKFDIFQKRRRLYGLDLARQFPEIYIFEGHPNVVTARNLGLLNSTAIGGTSLTSDHLLLLEELGIRAIVLCLDGDTAGKEATLKLVDEKLALHSDIQARIIDLPDGLDPDEFLRAKGLEAFLALDRPTAFEWRLKRYIQDGSDMELAAKAMIPLIVSEQSHITREELARVLAKNTGYPLSTIRSEIQRLSDTENARVRDARELVLKKMTRELERRPDEAETILFGAQQELALSASQYGASRFSAEACLKFIDGQKTAQEVLGDEFTGFVLGKDLAALQEALCGNWREDIVFMLGGRENAGKSSLAVKMAYDIARHPENNAVVIYHSIDDSAQQILPKFICVAEGSKTGLTLNEVIHPAYWKKQGWDSTSRREVGYQAVKALVADGHLVLKDITDGNGLTFIEGIITYYKERYPTRHLVYILDNFHKLPDTVGAKDDERVRVKRLSDMAKNIATRHHIAFLCTVEYTKMQPGTRPSNNNISESAQLPYDANIIAHLYNDLNDFAGQSEKYHEGIIHGQKTKMPVIEMIIAKCKVSSFKGSIFLNFFPGSSDFTKLEDDSTISS